MDGCLFRIFQALKLNFRDFDQLPIVFVVKGLCFVCLFAMMETLCFAYLFFPLALWKLNGDGLKTRAKLREIHRGKDSQTPSKQANKPTIKKNHSKA